MPIFRIIPVILMILLAEFIFAEQEQAVFKTGLKGNDRSMVNDSKKEKELIDRSTGGTNIIRVDPAATPGHPVDIASSVNNYDCIRIGLIDTVHRVEYDVHRNTGNILAAMAYSGDGYPSSLTMFLSTNNGQSWNQMFNLPMNHFIHDIACASYGNDFILAYTESNRIRALRFDANSGNNINFESGAQIVTPFMTGSTILEIELVSSLDYVAPVTRVYFLAAITADNKVYSQMSDHTAESWSFTDLVATNADHGLDLAVHEEDNGPSWPYSQYISFIEDDDEMSVYGFYQGYEWHRLLYEVIGPVEPYHTALAAHGGHVYCFTEINITEKSIRLYNSHDDGLSWHQLTFYGGDDKEYSCPDITGRTAAGVAYTYRLWMSNPPYVSVEGQLVWGPVGLPYAYDIVTCSPSPYLVYKPNVELLSNGQYGVLYIKNTASEPQHAWFCKAGNCCDAAGDANNDGTVNVGDAVYVISYVFKGGLAPICPPEGDANCDGAVNVGDAVYLIAYVFKGGPEPCCP